jgi:hypothetical protein
MAKTNKGKKIVNFSDDLLLNANAEMNPEPVLMENLSSVPNSSSNSGNSLSLADKSKDYIFQFLMLFLAITAGFFVENKREQYIENQSEKQYARSLYEDLKTDTAVIQRVLKYKIWSSEKMDSLLNILQSNNIRENNELIYYFERMMKVNDQFTSQDVTYQQLQSSGNFRFFDNEELYREISDYYNLYKRYLSLIENQHIEPGTLTDMEASLFHAKDLALLYNPNPVNANTVYLRPTKKLAPIHQDPFYLNYFNLKVADRSELLKSSVTWLSWLNDKSSKLLLKLKQEYKLE